MNTIHKLVVEFSGAGRKGMAFQGWAGPVFEWQGKAAPQVGFGKWQPDKNNPRNGGTVIFDALPYVLIMWGANGPGMRISDKTTKFAFAGLGADGNLWAAPLPKDADARAIFTAGGWQPPAADDIAQDILVIEIDPMHPADGKEKIMAILDAAKRELGLKGDWPDLVNHWPHLTTIHVAATQKFQEWEAKRTVARANQQALLEAEITAAIATLSGDGMEPSMKNVAVLMRPNNPRFSENIRRHCRHLFKQD